MNCKMGPDTLVQNLVPDILETAVLVAFSHAMVPRVHREWRINKKSKPASNKKFLVDNGVQRRVVTL